MLTTNTRFYALLLTAILATSCSDALLEPSHVGDKTPHLKTAGTDNPQANDQVRPPAPKCDLPSPSNRLEGAHPQGDRAAFEGWYLRLQNWQSQRSYSVIVGWWREESGARERGFVELIDSQTQRTYRMESSQLWFSDEGEALNVKIGQVQLTGDSLYGVFQTEDGHDVWLEVDFNGCHHWGNPDRPSDRSTMGLPERLPFIPLKWQVMHLDGSAVGKIAIDGQTTTLDDASVHFEKNWGDKFPTRWHWLQANQFTGETDVAFVGAGGPIFPFGFSPEGYMLGLRVGDDFFSWRTQDLARFQETSLTRTGDQLQWVFIASNGVARVKVTATAHVSDLIGVDVPTPDGLQMGAAESLIGDLTIELSRRDRRRARQLRYLPAEIYRSSTAALELGGEHLERVLTTSELSALSSGH
ncbi:MAG: tocopherol cyclase family protein [Bradymonadia bacterium]